MCGPHELQIKLANKCTVKSGKLYILHGVSLEFVSDETSLYYVVYTEWRLFCKPHSRSKISPGITYAQQAHTLQPPGVQLPPMVCYETKHLP